MYQVRAELSVKVVDEENPEGDADEAAEEDVAEEIDRKIASERMLRLLDTCLLPRERQILIMRYGIGGIPPQTQREIAASLNISRSYVSRLEKSALEKLRDAMGSP